MCKVGEMMKFKLIESRELTEVSRAHLKSIEASRISPHMAVVTPYENELKVHSFTTGNDYDIIFERNPIVTKQRQDTKKLRFNGNGTIVNGDIYDNNGTFVGPAFYGSPTTYNVYDYVIRCDDRELRMTHTQFINDINNGIL